MRVLVTGGRKYRNRRQVYADLDHLDATEVIDVIIEGEASGLDTLAREWAEDRGVPFHPFPADWDDIDRPGAVIKYSRGRPYDAAAGGIRNQKMLDEGQPDICCAWPGGSGTQDMIDRAHAALIEVRKFDKEGWNEKEPVSDRGAAGYQRRRRSGSAKVQEGRALQPGSRPADQGRVYRRKAAGGRD